MSSSHAVRVNASLLSLPPLWQESILENARLEAERVDRLRQRKTLSFSIAAALMAGVFARSGSSQAATLYQDAITGVADHDRAGGTGNYAPGYEVTADDGTLHYAFTDGDSVELRASGRDVFAVSVNRDASPVSLDVESGTLRLSAIREQTGAWGLAVGIDNTGNTITVNGDTEIYAQADDSVSGSGSGAHAVVVRDGGSVVFNGATDLQAYSPGYARAVWTSGRSSIVFNGPTTILAQSRGTLDAVYNSDLSSMTFNGDTHIAAYGIWPSDNAHAIYNDGVNSRLTVNGNLALTTVSQGSTAFGVRNQGIMEVSGDASVDVEGPRSSHGIANTHRLARMTWHGDVDVRVRGGSYVPFGNPSGLSNDRTPGAFMRFEGAVNVDVASAAETYGLVSTGTIEFASTTAPVSFTVASSCEGCAVYGLRNFGTVSVAGGLTVSTTASGDGAAYSIWSVPLDSQDASVTVNQGGGHRVQLDGDIVTATDPVNGFTGSVDINLDTSDSWLRGQVGGRQADTGFSVGQADLAFSGGAAWMPQGSGTLANDFGTGTLALADGGAIDMAGYWGEFSPGAVPAHAYRTLSIDSSDNDGATVVLGDDARFLLLSDITGKSGTATADRIVFGSGIASFSATGTQGVGIVYDPVLDDTSWVNADTVRTGTTIGATSPIDIVDASAAAGGNAAFAAVTGLDRQWSGTFENALVQFTYAPQVALSDDGRRIVLTGISIRGTEDDAGGDGDGTGDPGTSPELMPSTTVQAAADAADSVLSLWRMSGHGAQQRVREPLGGGSSPRSGIWAQADNGELTADTAYARRYRQDYSSVSVGADRSFELDSLTNVTGFSAGHVRATAQYAQGRGELTGTTAGLYTGWTGSSGAYLMLGAEAASLENRYRARDSQGSDITGEYRARARRAYAEGGYPFRLTDSWYLEPQLELSAGVVARNDHTTSNGVLVRQEQLDASFARAGLSLGRTLQGPRWNGRVYARASALRHFGDPAQITASRDGGSIVPETADREGMGSEYVLGANLSLRRAGVFLEASTESGVDVKRDWGVQAGLRYRW
jgi:outer membrane autotransporter protein